jgi:hypothetical protein
MKVTIRHQEAHDVESTATLFADQSVIDGTMRLPLASVESVRKRLARADDAIRLVGVHDDLPVGD